MKTTKLLILSIILTFSCAKKSVDPSSNAGSIMVGNIALNKPDKSTMSNVEKKANTAEIAIETMAGSFESFDASKKEMIFKGNDASLKALKAGSVVQFSGHSIKKIVSVTESGGKTIVKTTAAKFIDYYKSAKIDYATKFNWDITTIKNARVGLQDNGQAFKLRQKASNEYTFEGKLKGWDITLGLSPSTQGANRRLDLSLVAKRGTLGGIEFKGFISNFDITSNIEVQNSQATAYSEQQDNLAGELDVKLAFVSTGNQDALIELPLDFYNVMLLTGGIPVSYRVKFNLKIFPEIAAGSSSQANIKLKYSASNGFSYANQSLTPRAVLADYSPSLTGNTGSASTGIVGVGVGVEFPRFEIGIFDTVVVPYMLINSSVVNYFESGLPGLPGPCNRTRASIKAVAGLNLNFLGNTFARDVTLFETTKSFKKEGSKCPD